jgi:multidrug efflux system membrane fusion protein
LTLDNQVNVSTGTVRAKARFDNADGRLFPNQFVNIRLQLGTAEGVLVPVTAVRTGLDGDYVYVIDAESIARTRPVKRGLATDTEILIAQGLQAGERVVAEGGDRVKDGAAVRRADAAGPPAGEAKGGPGGGGRPNLDKLPPEEREKVEKMTPEERRSYFQQKRAEQGGVSGRKGSP